MLLLGAAMAQFSAQPSAQPSAASGVFPVPVYFFWGEGCPHCATQKRFHTDLQREFPNLVLHEFEVYNSAENQTLMRAMAAAYGRDARGVPMTFIGDEAWVGFAEITARQIRDSVVRYSTYAAPDPIDRVAEGFRPILRPPAAETEAAFLAVPFVGRVDVAHQSLWLATALIALVDGFNPCSLWVLAILLAVVINTRSRTRVLLVGLTFLTVTTLVYGLFIAGLFSIFSFVGFIGWIRALVAGIALAFALVNIKDYFAWQQGVSFTIADAQKPGIYQRIRRIMSAEGSLPVTLAATAGMALGVTLVELPCTAGLPMLWTNLLAGAGTSATAFAWLLLLYMLIYLLDELLVFGVVVTTMRVSRVQEQHGRVLKLVGGSVMLALALVMLFAPTLLEGLTGTLLLFGGAVALAVVVMLVHRVVHPASSPLNRG
jgi:cytochrome c biogenesis protein CcdA/glutaredoxin